MFGELRAASLAGAGRLGLAASALAEGKRRSKLFECALSRVGHRGGGSACRRGIRDAILQDGVLKGGFAHRWHRLF
jgi:hypothetical protein